MGLGVALTALALFNLSLHIQLNETGGQLGLELAMLAGGLALLVASLRVSLILNDQHLIYRGLDTTKVERTEIRQLQLVKMRGMSLDRLVVSGRDGKELLNVGVWFDRNDIERLREKLVASA